MYECLLLSVNSRQRRDELLHVLAQALDNYVILNRRTAKNLALRALGCKDALLTLSVTKVGL